jgi:hypothetical protein
MDIVSNTNHSSSSPQSPNNSSSSSNKRINAASVDAVGHGGDVEIHDDRKRKRVQ